MGIQGSHIIGVTSSDFSQVPLLNFVD